jgi:hypothetical protein
MYRCLVRFNLWNNFQGCESLFYGTFRRRLKAGHRNAILASWKRLIDGHFGPAASSQ